MIHSAIDHPSHYKTEVYRTRRAMFPTHNRAEPIAPRTWSISISGHDIVFKKENTRYADIYVYTDNVFKEKKNTN